MCDPAVVVVMGVSGSGKTTIAVLLAQLLRWDLADADDFHSPASLRKMEKGIPLTDEDRWPWLYAIAGWIDDVRRAGRRGIVTCSALKRSYRRILIGDRQDVRLIYLQGDMQLISQRMLKRRGHFMPAALLRSQFDTLEESEENPIIVPVAAQPAQIVERVRAELRV